MKKIKLIDPTRIDYLLVVSVLFLVIFGTAMVYSASSFRAELNHHGSAYYFLHQFAMACFGILLMSIIANIDYHKWFKYSTVIYVASVLALLLLLTKAQALTIIENGQTRSFRFGLVRFQPSGFACYALILFLAFSLGQHRAQVEKLWGGYLKYGVLALLIIVPVAMQRDMGTSVVIALTVYCIFFFAGAPLRFLLPSAGLAAASGFILIRSNAYQWKNFMTFWNYIFHGAPLPWQLDQSLKGMASGGLFGAGIGNSRFKFAWLPEAHKDFIFSIICEEIGWIGAIGVLALFFLILYRGLKVAEQAPDNHGQLLAGGITAFILSGAVINAAVALVLLPTTGIPMPFLSFGGSSLISHLAALGLLVNISAQSSASYTNYSNSQTYVQNLDRNPFEKPNRRSTSRFLPLDGKVRMFH